MDSDLSHLQWRAPEYLLSLPTPQLSTRQQALDYFSLSPFFDKHSNNNQLRMQIMFSRGGGLDGINEEEELKRFIGIEYVISQNESIPPNLYIVQKRNRTTPTTTTVISVYHILNANVYQAPSLYTVLNERLLTSLNALSSSMSDLIALKPTWSTSSHYQWNIAPPPSQTCIESLSQTAQEQEEESTQREEEGESQEGKKPKLDDGEEGRDEREEEEFNPLLFRALQGVGRSLEREEEMERIRREEGLIVNGAT
ncbi:hypothetical protein JCM5353_000701 [Sporobolomyces roseus]